MTHREGSTPLGKVGMPVSELDTPALVVDLDLFESNVTQMAAVKTAVERSLSVVNDTDTHGWWSATLSCSMHSRASCQLGLACEQQAR